MWLVLASCTVGLSGVWCVRSVRETAAGRSYSEESVSSAKSVALKQLTSLSFQGEIHRVKTDGTN